MRSKSLVVLAAAFLLVASVAPAVATDGSLSVAVEQDDDGSAIATVTHNESAVENASVVVNATDGNYVGEGNYTTDENGTVGLPAPEENVTIDVFAEYGNETASTTAELVVVDANETDETVEDGPFGARVSAFVRNLLGDGSGIGQELAEWVVANNPGNAPDHAGPPDDDRGPPAFASDGDDEDGNVTGAGASDDPGKSGERGNGNGPPEDRGSNGNDNGNAKGHGK